MATSVAQLKGRAPQPGRRRWLRRFVWLALVLAAFWLVAAFGVPFAVNCGWLTGFVERQLSRATGASVNLCRLRMHGWHSVVCEGLVLGRADEPQPLLRVGRIEINFSPRQLLRRRIESVRATNAVVSIDMAGGKAAAQPAAGVSGAGFDWNALPNIGSLEVRDAKLHLITPAGSVSFQGANLDLREKPGAGQSREQRSATLNAAVARIEWESGGRADLFDGATLTCQVVADMANRQIEVGSLSLGLADYMGAHLAGSLVFKQQAVRNLCVEVKNLDSEVLYSRFGRLLRVDSLLGGVNGRFDVTVFSEHLSLDDAVEQGTLVLRVNGEDLEVTLKLPAGEVNISDAVATKELVSKIGRRFRHWDTKVRVGLSHPEITCGNFARKIASEAVQLTGNARVELDKGEVNDMRLAIALPSALSVEVENCRMRFSGEVQYGARVVVRCDDLDAVARDWGQLFGLQSLQTAGTLRMDARVDGDSRRIHLEGRAELERATAQFGAAPLYVGMPAPAADGGVKRGRYRVSGVQSRVGVSAQIPFADFPRGTVTFDAVVQADGVEFPLNEQVEKVSGLQLAVRGASELSGQDLIIEGAKLNVADYLGARLEAALVWNGRHAREGHCAVSGVDVKKFWAHFSRLLPDLKPYDVSGNLALNVKYSENRERGKSAVVEFSADKLSAVSTSMELPSGVENLQVRGAAELGFSDDYRAVKLKAKMTLGDAIVYHDKFFKDFSGGQMAVDAGAEVDLREVRVARGAVGVEAKDVLKVSATDITVDIPRRTFSGVVVAQFSDTGAMYDGLVKETYQTLVPALKTSSVHGKVVFDGKVAFTGEEGSISGQVGFQGLSAAIGGVEVVDVWGTFPLSIRTGFGTAANAASVADGTTVTGAISNGITIGRVSSGSITVEALRLWPRIVDNRLVFATHATLSGAAGRPAALDAKLCNGRLILWDFSTSDLLVSPRKLQTCFSLHGVDTGMLLKALGLPSYPGTLSSSECRLSFAEGDIAIQGSVTAAVCDGEIVVSDLKVDGVLGVAPVVGADVQLRGLDLEQLTSALPGFGVISGVLEGYARRIRVQSGRPYSLDLNLRTVPQPGVRQWVDRNAVRSLMILATGEVQPGVEPLLVLGGIKYKTFGIKCQINDDNVCIEGVSKRGDRHAILESALTSVPQLTITVVTGRPISYEDVLARLKTAQKSARERAKSRN